MLCHVLFNISFIQTVSYLVHNSLPTSSSSHGIIVTWICTLIYHASTAVPANYHVPTQCHMFRHSLSCDNTDHLQLSHLWSELLLILCGQVGGSQRIYFNLLSLSTKASAQNQFGLKYSPAFARGCLCCYLCTEAADGVKPS